MQIRMGKADDNMECTKECSGIIKSGYRFPDWELDNSKVNILMISETPPVESSDYYSEEITNYMATTIQAFCDAGFSVAGLRDIISLGFQITTAIKCPKIDYGIPNETIKACSSLLEEELEKYPNAKAYILMGDTAVNAINNISRKRYGSRAVPAGSTYKIRNGQFMFGNIRVFPSYLQTGKNYLIEKSKRVMIAEDIKRAFEYTEAFV